MAQFIGCKFINSTEVLDGKEYRDCEFTNCRIVITRGNFSIVGCIFSGCVFEFGGEAANIRSVVMMLLKQEPPKPSISPH